MFTIAGVDSRVWQVASGPGLGVPTGSESKLPVVRGTWCGGSDDGTHWRGKEEGG